MPQRLAIAIAAAVLLTSVNIALSLLGAKTGRMQRFEMARALANGIVSVVAGHLLGWPIAQWLCGPLRAWAESLLGETRLSQEGFFEPKKLQQRWREHLSGKRDWSPGLWHVLMFQAWFDPQKSAVPEQTEAAAELAV